MNSAFLVASSGILLLAASSAFAAPAPNLSVSYTPPGLTLVYSPGTYGVNVANIGNADAGGVQLTIQLPKTGTSPQVYIMGNLAPGYSPCFLGGASGTVAGTKLICNLGTVKKNKSTTVTFTIGLPEKTGDLVFSSSATTTTTPETNPANNTNIVHTATLDYYENTFSFDINGDAPYLNQHCTGLGGLTAYFECTKFPGSISSHDSVFHDDGSISIPGEPDYEGSWSLSGEDLSFTYTFIPSGEIELEFNGRGVPGTGCFEGLTRFPDGAGGYSPYVSPYRVCPE